VTTLSLTTRFLRQVPVLSPQSRLFCFPFAGGSASVFAGWGEAMKPDTEVWAAQPRGRGARFREVPYQTVEEMVEDYLVVLRPHLDLPYAFYGHSLGGLLAFELTKQLQAEGMRLPERLFIGASAPPVLGLIHPRIHHLADSEFVEQIQLRYSGIPAQVLNEPELLSMFLPVLKADFAAYENYDRKARTRVLIPVTAFAGADDRGIRSEMMALWQGHTDGAFDLRDVEGDHLFLPASGKTVLSAIQQTLLASHAQGIRV
jgi:medium-chain acyl-[acyl-carrier-protein] hydrolase